MDGETTAEHRDDDAAVIEAFREYRASHSRRVRNELVESHLGLAVHVARRAARGRLDDDVRQVAMLGLVKAVERFDPDRGVPFAAFAVRTIEGEVKRHFRDGSWAVRVPRRAQELHLLVRTGAEDLTHRLGRAPTVVELAELLSIEVDDVIVGLEAGDARQAAPLDIGDAVAGAAGPTASGGFDDVEIGDEVARLVASLDERERRIVELRFFDDLSQSEIAERMGMSQMHVSRLLRRACESMRAQALGPRTDPGPAPSASASD